jgi:hypothetical protein
MTKTPYYFVPLSQSSVIMFGHHFRNVTLETYDPFDTRNYWPYSKMSMRPERFLLDKIPLLESGCDGLINYLGLVQRFRCNLWLEVSQSTHYNKGDVRIRDYWEVIIYIYFDSFCTLYRLKKNIINSWNFINAS